jgi:uncharacterized short protein YbdD (DUF466 family)
MTLEQWRESVRRAVAIVRRIVGVPDYDGYLAHVRACHPDTIPMTRAEFERARLDDKYSRPGHRCC